MIFKTLLCCALLLGGCSSNRELAMDMPNRMEPVRIRSNESVKHSIVINSVTFSNKDMSALEKGFGRSMKSIVQNEFTNNNFRVLAREEIDAVINEDYFDKNIIGIVRKRNFTPSDYVVNLKITNVGVDFTGFWLPIVYNKLTHTIEFSVEMTIINNFTGEITGSSGSGRVSYNTQNLLIFIGDINVNVAIPLENALKMAIRNAILNAKI